jgi:hypothetical protein
MRCGCEGLCPWQQGVLRSGRRKLLNRALDLTAETT